MLIFYILTGVYLLAVNFYGIVLMHYQKKYIEEDECFEEYKVKDGKLFLAGILGGAAGIYIFMLVRKYRLKSPLLMIFMPVLIALYVFLIYILIKNNFGLVLFTENAQPIASLSKKFLAGCLFKS